MGAILSKSSPIPQLKWVMECVFAIVTTYLSNLKFIHCSSFPGAQAGGGTQLSILGFTSPASVASRTLFRGGLGGQH